MGPSIFFRICLLPILLVAALGLPAVAAASSQPNVVYIVVDNVTFDNMGKAYGGKTITPSLDSIANEGALMQRMYVTSPLCTPSRYSILTGRYPSNCNLPAYLEEYPAGEEEWDVNAQVEPGRPNLPSTLQSAGYTTGFVGKFHGAHGHFPELKARGKWSGKHITDPEVTPALQELQQNLKKHLKKCGFDWAGAPELGNGLVSSMKGIESDGVHHNLEWEVKHALEFLDRQQGKEKPFFLYFSTKLLHMPVTIEEDLLLDYSDVGRYTEEGLLDKAPEVPMPSRKEVLALSRKEMGEAGREDKTLDKHAAAIRLFDFGVKALLDKLNAIGAEENTIVVFVSDNNQPGKSTVYEGGIHIPSAIKWPATIKPGSKIPQIVSTLDIAATLFDAAGTEPPAEMNTDGKSFLPLLEGKDVEWDNIFLAEYNVARAVVTPRWKYIAVRYPEERWEKIRAEDARNPEAPDFSGNKNKMEKWIRKTKPILTEGQLPMAMNIYRYWSTFDMNHIKRAGDYPALFELDQLYDLEKDPTEQNNLAKHPEYAAKLAEMKKLMKREARKLDRPFGEFSSK